MTMNMLDGQLDPAEFQTFTLSDGTEV
ncbi:hypothetical protein WOSG25_380050, partial [Weissella oryzae SG25]